MSFVDLEESGVVNESNTEDVANLVHYLLERKIAISPSEHLPWVYFSMQPGGVSTDALGAKRVGMVGSGFLGARIAQELARARIKEVILLDDRKAGPRDATYFECGSDLVKDGRRHVDVAQEILKSTGYESTRKFDAPMSDEEALRDVFEQSDVVITALEWFSPNTLHAVNAAALEAGKPWMSVYFDGSEALIGPIYVPGETPCYNEFELQNEACVTLQDDYHVYKDSLLDEGAKEDWHLVLPPFLAVASGWTATAVLPFLSSGRSFVVGRSVRVDFERLSVDHQDVLKLPRCPACAPFRSPYRHTFL